MHRSHPRASGHAGIGLVAWLMAVALLLAACGGGGDGSAQDGGSQPPAATGTRIALSSDTGDYIGGGRSYTYTQADARISVSSDLNRLTVQVEGDQSWRGDFELPAGQTRLVPGTYDALKRWPFHDASTGGLAWTGEGRGCSTSTGTITVLSASYSGSTLTAVALRFEQRCEGAGAALRGDVRWIADDPTRPPGPQTNVPGGLWRAPATDVPASGNYVLLASSAGDYIGAGIGRVYTSANARLTASGSGTRFTMGIEGDESWRGEFAAMDSLPRLAVGYYPDLARYPFHNTSRGGLSWSGEGRACNTLRGWFVVDSVSYVGDDLAELTLRFEQRCEGGSATLRGQIRWRADDTTVTTGPVNPPPDGLWRAAAGSVPVSGNHLLLQSDSGDFVGAGRTYQYTNLNARLTPRLEGLRLSLSVNSADVSWNGNFVAMDHLSTLQPGYYGNVRRYPFHNPVRGGMDWSGGGSGCNTLIGWFVIDRIVVVSGILQSVELRFEQRCEGAAAALRGQLRWSADDTTQPPGPQNPAPDNLWQPADGATPASGNYVYLEGRFGDFIVGGRTHLYTPADALLQPSELGRVFRMQVEGFEQWTGSFGAMDRIGALQLGYYADATRFSGIGPGLDWGGEGRGCNQTRGWFVVDRLERRNGVLELIELRFEQYCDGSLVPLRGKLRWSAADGSTAPGPVQPPPTGLWQPPAGSTPASGNYVYILSTPGDFIGDGRSQLYTAAVALLDVSFSSAMGLRISVQGDERWGGSFVPMNGLSGLQPGYYGRLQRAPFHNPVVGGFDWSGEGRACNRLDAWVVIDEITVVSGILQSVTLRFQQNCEGALTPLHGKLRWSAGESTTPPGPVWPAPAGLWQPAAGTTPASGSFVLLQSGRNDFIGGGSNWLYTRADARVDLTPITRGLNVRVGNDWTADFQAMLPLTRLQPGYYGGLQRYPFNNVVKGGLSWSGMGRGCNRLSGWFVIDSITYSGDRVTAVDLRFEQLCEGSSDPLRGQVRWSETDASATATGLYSPRRHTILRGPDGRPLRIPQPAPNPAPTLRLHPI